MPTGNNRAFLIGICPSRRGSIPNWTRTNITLYHQYHRVGINNTDTEALLPYPPKVLNPAINRRLANSNLPGAWHFTSSDFREIGFSFTPISEQLELFKAASPYVPDTYFLGYLELLKLCC
jgi:hypothetical protein